VVANVFVFKDLKEEPIEEHKVSDPKGKYKNINILKSKNNNWR